MEPLVEFGGKAERAAGEGERVTEAFTATESEMEDVALATAYKCGNRSR